MKTIQMNAVINTRFGSPDYLQIIQVAIPKINENEILIKVKASTVTKADTMMRRGIPKFSRLFMGFTKPKIKEMGTGFSGIIECVGRNVSQFKIGDKVFGETGMAFGANAEYIVMNSTAVVMLKPEFLDYKEAATLTDGFLTSFNFLHNLGKIKEGDKVLIIGASGSLGTAAVQLAKYYNANVAGVSSSKNANLIYELGADYHIDYNTIDYNQGKKQYDIIYDTVGVSSFSKSKNILSPKGRYLSPVLNLRLLFAILFTSFSSERKAIFSATGLLAPMKLKDMLKCVLDILGSADTKVIIDKTFKLEEVKQAHKYVDSNRKVGNIVLVG